VEVAVTLMPPAVPVFTAGTPAASMVATMNSLVRDPLTFLLAPPVVRLLRTTALTVAEGVHQYVAFNVATEDTVSGWSAGDPTKYTTVVPGWYTATARVSLSGTGAANLELIAAIGINGGSHTGQSGGAGWEGMQKSVPTGVAAQPKTSVFAGEIYLNVGDVVQLDLWFSTESAIVAVDITAGWQCALDLVYSGV
jgi:hypothetical protein